MGEWRMLARRVLAGYRLDSQGIHGPRHWLRVRANGRALAAMTPGADAQVVELFALLHDGCRHDEGHDLVHGARAAEATLALADDGVLDLASDRLLALAKACRWHEHGKVSDEPTIGCCWDADRLDLSRLRRRPQARLLSTTAARDPVLQARVWQAGEDDEQDAAGAAAWGIAPRG
jgi:uncharacterized protein